MIDWWIFHWPYQLTPDWGIGAPGFIGGGLITLCADYGATPVAGLGCIPPIDGGGCKVLYSGGLKEFIAPVEGG